MSKHHVFIYGSCVSRDTFEHFDADQFELVQYVARQSALSAYTRPVTLVEPPQLESPFQQRMVSGDYASSLQTLIPEAAHQTDLVLVDLTDERLGAYVLPDGSVVTRSVELIQSGAESTLPPGSQHLAFGSDQHFQYWSQGLAAVGELFRQHMPHAAVVLLHVPWAESSDSGRRTPDSFGITAAVANPIFDSYAQVAAQALRAKVVSLKADDVVSSPHHPWGEAPFHYAEGVYARLVEEIVGSPGRPQQRRNQRLHDEVHAAETTRTPRPERARTPARPPEVHEDATAPNPPNFLIAGTQHAGAEWLGRQLDVHPEVFVVTRGKGTNYYNRPARLNDAAEGREYLQAYEPGQRARWRGDCTVDYFWHSVDRVFGPQRPNTPANVQAHLAPDAPVFITLREPVSRAIAAYWHHFSLGRFDLSTGVFRVPNNLGVVDLGFYRRHYEHWASVLGERQLHVLVYDDLVRDPQGELTKVLDVLGLQAPDGYWDEVSLKSTVPTKAWLKPFQARRTITEQEIGALFELYRSEVSFVEGLVGRELPEWHDRDHLIRALTSPSTA